MGTQSWLTLQGRRPRSPHANNPFHPLEVTNGETEAQRASVVFLANRRITNKNVRVVLHAGHSSKHVTHVAPTAVL